MVNEAIFELDELPIYRYFSIYRIRQRVTYMQNFCTNNKNIRNKYFEIR